MIRAVAQIENVDDVTVRIEVSASLSEWRQIKEQLGSKYPSWQLGIVIQRAISLAQARFYANEEITA